MADFHCRLGADVAVQATGTGAPIVQAAWVRLEDECHKRQLDHSDGVDQLHSFVAGRTDHAALLTVGCFRDGRAGFGPGGKPSSCRVVADSLVSAEYH